MYQETLIFIVSRDNIYRFVHWSKEISHHSVLRVSPIKKFEALGTRFDGDFIPFLYLHQEKAIPAFGP